MVASSLLPCSSQAQDIDEFLKEEIKGPATFSCKTGSGCKFEEPAMNALISDIFADPYITLDCSGGECLHYSQVPGYEVSLLRYSNSPSINPSARGRQNQTTQNGSL